jgi:glycerol kinase
MELRIEGRPGWQELRPGVVVREQHRHGQERVVRSVTYSQVECVGVASGRTTFIRAATMAHRYRIVPRAS